MDQRIYVAKVGKNKHLKEVQQIDTNKIHRYHKLGFERVDDKIARDWLAKQIKKRDDAGVANPNATVTTTADTNTESTQTQTT
ncbi:MAG: hypothetical protein AAFR07_05615 [Pseudomonadota bacterium]